MRAIGNVRTAAEVLVDQLIKNGVRHVFCVPGESYLAVLDAFHDREITVTVCRQEGGAAMMAEAVGKATGRPGVCFVTRGPGATNASPGIHIAQQDSTPLIMFAGQVARDVKEREALQELDFRAAFGGMAKWVTEIDDAARVPEIVSRAFYTATSGRPGPVVIALPEDMLRERVVAADAPPFEPIETSPGAAEMRKLEQLLCAGGASLCHRRRQPLVGAGARRDAAVRGALRAAGRDQLSPVAVVRSAPPLLRRRPRHRRQSQTRRRASRRRTSSSLLVGGRLGELASQGYTLFDIPGPQTKLVHVHPGAEELGRLYRPHLAIHASPVPFAEAAEAMQPPGSIPWRERTHTAHADYLAWTDMPTEQPGGVNLGAVMVWLRENLPDDTILCNGAGNYAAWIHRFYRFRRFATHIAPTSASMGYGMPAAVAMKRLHPERMVISVNGDGDFLMNGQEFATAVQYELPIVVIVCDNGIYGTIRMHQEREYPGRVCATTLRNPDFAAYARAFGGFGITVERTQDFAAAFEAAAASGKPAIVHLKIDPEAITPMTTLAQIRKQAQLALAD